MTKVALNDSRWKTAAVTDGPVGKVLDKWWNQLHDAERALSETLREYGDAEHFTGGPAQHDALIMIKKIQVCIKEMEHLTMQTFSDLMDTERDFVAKHGAPEDYADKMRKQTFPR